MEKIFSFAKEQGMTITADMIMPRLGETLDDIAGALQYVDYFFPNYDEACLMTGEKDEAKVADKLFSYGIKKRSYEDRYSWMLHSQQRWCYDRASM